ncbi:hypothetical protein ACIPJK_23745 [Streptomyces roseus]|uniref:hypothetical protein n=1 Tax=Streptomyces roseus TaxID=66430 RepID=UPI0038158931
MTDPRGPAAPKPRAPKPVAPIDWARHYAAQREQQPEPVCKSEQGCHLVVPCNPGCGAPRPAAEQPARHTVDTITSDALDQLYAELERLRAEVDRLHRQHDAADALRYAFPALDEPQETRP